MKILVVGDVHWSQYSSILRRRGEKYSYRLENLIESVDWAENLADETNCDFIVYLGDFFDRSEINSEELSALREISWSKKQHYFLVGNHEAGRGDLFYNSANIFGIANFTVIDTPTHQTYYRDNITFEFIPYILEENRKPLNEYVLNPLEVQKRVIFSHNDIKDFQMGQFISKNGFSIDEIQDNCDLFLNGHLHNGGKVADKIINVGNLSGQNFSEDAFKYEHSVIVLDTYTMKCAVYENPYALNFYKLDFTKNDDIDYINEISMKMKRNSIATIKCNEKDLEFMRQRFDPKHRDLNSLIPYNCNMADARIVAQFDISSQIVNKIEESIHIDHLKEFSDYMINLLGDSEVLQHELSEVCR